MRTSSEPAQIASPLRPRRAPPTQTCHVPPCCRCGPVEGGSHYYATVRSSPITGAPVKRIRGEPVPAPQPPPVNFAPRQAGQRVKRTSEKIRLSDALENQDDPLVLCDKNPPHVITHPNQAWLQMCGYTAEEVEGLTNSILTGPETDRDQISQLLSSVRREEPAVHTLVNYKKGGVRFVNHLKVVPVYGELQPA